MSRHENTSREENHRIAVQLKGNHERLAFFVFFASRLSRTSRLAILFFEAELSALQSSTKEFFGQVYPMSSLRN